MKTIDDTGRKKSKLSPLVLRILEDAKEPMTAARIASSIRNRGWGMVNTQSVNVCLTFAMDGREVERVRPSTDPLHWKLRAPKVDAPLPAGEV
jgi:repressor of nif and glnA expression